MTVAPPTLDVLALAPILIVLTTALAVLLADLWLRDKQLLAYLALAGVVLAGLISLVMWSQTPSSFHNMAVNDRMALFFNFIFLIVAGLGILLAVDYLRAKGLQRGEYYALLLFSTGGMMFLAAATDLIIVFLGLEIMSVSLYILVGFNRRQLASVEAAMKYFILGAFASAFFLYGVALTYGATGTTNLAQAGSWLTRQAAAHDPVALVGLGLLLIGFAFKVAAVPFQWWTPDVYQGAPTSVTAFMSVGAKAAAFAALMRVLHSAFAGPTFTADWVNVTAVLALVTMSVGNLAALAQKDVKRMLAYSSIAHAGYLLVGLTATAGSATGRPGVLFYLLSYAFMTVGAFTVACAVERRDAFSTSLADYAGLAQRQPLWAAAMAVFMLSLTGIPPLVGFWGKLYVFRAAVEADMSWLAIAGVINSAISAFYYLGVVVHMYMHRLPAKAEAAPADPEPTPGLAGTRTGVVLGVAALATLVFGIWPGVLAELVRHIP